MEEKEIVSKVIEESAKISEVLNGNFMKKFVSAHNIPEKNSLLQLKQEVVAKKGYFKNKKKHYVLHIINQEGVDYDVTIVKGIETRRSDYPAKTKEKLTELLDILVKSDKFSPSVIRDFVLTTREEFLDACNKGEKDIARPVSFSRKLKDYKRVPPAVEGMLLWNRIEYDYFVPGTRGRQFMIRGINLMDAPEKIRKNLHKMTPKNKYIAIPEEEERLPPYYDLDVEAMVNFCWDNRVKILLESIWDVLRIDNSKEKYVFEFF